MRRIDNCLECGEVREIAAHGLCFTHYREKQRANERQLPPGVDRHSPGVRREQKKLFRGFTSVMVGLSDLGVSRADVLAIRRIVEPYLAPIAKFLSLPPEENEVAVAGEQKCESGSLFTQPPKISNKAGGQNA